MSKNQKIVILHYVPFIHTDNGIARVILNFWQAIDHTKFQFVVLHHNWRLPKSKINAKSDLEKELNASGIKTYSVSDPKEHFFKHRKELNKFFQKHANYVDIVHSHSYVSGWYFLYLAKKYSIQKRIAHAHNTKNADLILHRVRNVPILKLTKHFATSYLACSKEAGKCIFGTTKCKIIENAINLDKFKYNKKNSEKLRNEFHIPQDAIVVGSVGRLTIEKNYSFLIDVLKLLNKKNKKIYLTLFGEGNEETALLNKAKNLGIKDRLIIGRTEKAWEAYSFMDIFVLTSLYEGVPLVAIEAQAAGLPCIFSNNITKKVALSDKVKYLSLKDSAEKWATSILKANLDIREAPKQLLASKYNVKNSVKDLEKEYLKSLDDKLNE